MGGQSGKDRIEALERSVAELQAKLRQIEEALDQENDELYQKLSALQQVELGVAGDGIIKGTLEWISFDALGIKTGGQPPEQVIVFKHAITYIRALGETSKNHTGMYF